MTYYVTYFHACCVGNGAQSGVSDVPLSIVLNHWLLVSPVFTDLFSLKMVAIRRAPAPPPHLSSQDSDSSLTASSSPRAKVSNHESRLPEQSSPLTDGRLREDPLDRHRDDNSRDTVNYACESMVPPIAHWFLRL